MKGKKLVDIADLEERDYRILLTPCAASVKLRLLQGWNFDRIEPQGSADDRMFIDLLVLVSEVYEDLNQVLSKIDPDNLKKMASLIERDLVSVAASLTSQAIVTHIRDELFSILVDNTESWDHLIVALRYVDNRGSVTERVLGLVSDHDSTASSPKAGINSLLNKHQLNVSKLRGQGCNEARSLYKRFNVVKDLIMGENKCAYSVNCFARELHLALVEVSRDQTDVSMLFIYITYFLKAVGASSKYKDVLGDIKYENIVEGTPCCETMIGQGSYYGILMRLISSFSLVLEMLEDMDENVTTVHRFELNSFLRYMPCFEFAFLLLLMKDVLGITNDLSQALQRKYDLVNIMALVEVSKHGIEKMKDDGWGVLFDDVCSFSLEHDRFIPNMEDAYNNPWARRGRAAEEVTNLHHYRDELFSVVIDSQLQELNNRFSKEKMDLLLCSAVLILEIHSLLLTRRD